jgi:hypothetical protein
MVNSGFYIITGSKPISGGGLPYYGVNERANLTESCPGYAAPMDIFGLYVTPNPTAETASLEYSLNSSGNVTIEIFDLSGKLVRTLIDDFRSEGFHRENWDCSGNSGERVANGIYLFRMISGGYAETAETVVVSG